MNIVKGTFKRFQFRNKKLSMLSALVLFLSVLSSNQIISKSDSTNAVNQKQIYPIVTGLDLIAFAGAGMTTRFNSEIIQIKNGSIIAFGIELPFTKSNIFGFELYAHSWIAKSLTLQGHISYLDYSFSRINDNYYSQLGISASIKCYMFSIGKRFRFSTHLGWLFYSPKPSYRALDLGFGFYYKLTDSYTISLNRRLSYKPCEFFTNDADAPSSILLMMNYEFNVKL
jgi:hypothetical protein